MSPQQSLRGSSEPVEQLLLRLDLNLKEFSVSWLSVANGTASEGCAC